MSNPHIYPAPRYVYGDSTPFDSEADFIATLRASVECCVELMRSQHAVDCARARVAEAGAHVVRTRCELAALAEALEGALRATGPRQTEARDVAQRVSTMAKGAITSEARRAQSVLDATVVRADQTVGEARRSAAKALGALVSAHELPGARFGFRIFATEERYGAEALVTLSCGLRLTFDATLPDGHPMRTPCKVRALRDPMVVTVPQQVGWWNKRVEPTAVHLEGLTILGASVDGSRGALLLGKSLRSGIAHAFDVDWSGAVPRAQWHDGDDTDVFELSPQDADGISRLLRAFEHRATDVPGARRTMTEATLEGRPLGEHDPSDVCARVLGLVAPVAREIARRSGAPGELVLRRNLDAGHRDEVFVTTAELLEAIATLPPSLRRAFALLELEKQPRSRRAPSRVRPSFEEISACEFLSVS